MLAIVDTNVFVSGLLGSGTPRKIFLAFKEKKFSLAISEILFTELKFVIMRPNFRLLIDTKEKEDLIVFIKSHAIFVKPGTKINICRDTKDNKVIECALEAGADFIVTGDKDLLCLNPFQNIHIITPKEFADFLK